MSDHPPWKHYRVLIKDVPWDADLEEFPKDITAIVKALARFGFEISRDDACRLWELFSNDLDAGWMHIDRDNCEWIFHCVSRFFEVKIHATNQAVYFEHVS